MRIEYQGHIEVQPPYQHVGYIAAGVNPAVMRRDGGPLFLPLVGVTILLVLVAHRFGRREVNLRNSLVFLGIITLTGLSAMGAVWCQFFNPFHLTKEFVATVQTMERLCAVTEAWEKKHGRLPTAEEWRRLCGEQRDAWGREFEYELHKAQCYGDGTGYRIRSRRDMIDSCDFGPDGLMGTDDDRHSGASGQLAYRKVDLSAIPHARQPRYPLPEMPRRR